MKVRFIVLISIIAISLIISVSAFIYSSNIQNSPSESSLMECNSISESGENSINIVFLADKEKAKKYVDYLLTVSPFKEQKSKFNFYSVDAKGSCDLYQGIALLCNDKQTKKYASACPNDYIVTINNDYPASIRSSSLGEFLSINEKQPFSVLVHELGHAIFNFAEEYNAGGARIPLGSQNCQGSCEGFVGDHDGCYQECTDSSHYRSIENGVMRTLSTDDYGAFDKQLAVSEILKQSSSNSVTGFATALSEEDCSKQKQYIVEISKNGNEFKTISTELAAGCAGAGSQFGQYSVEADDTKQGNIPEYFFSDEINENQELVSPPIETNDIPITVTIPAPAQTLSIKNPQNQIVQTIKLNSVGYEPCKE